MFFCATDWTHERIAGRRVAIHGGHDQRRRLVAVDSIHLTARHANQHLYRNRQTVHHIPLHQHPTYEALRPLAVSNIISQCVDKIAVCVALHGLFFPQRKEVEGECVFSVLSPADYEIWGASQAPQRRLDRSRSHKRSCASQTQFFSATSHEF